VRSFGVEERPRVKDQGECLVWPCILGMHYAPMRNRSGTGLTSTPQELNGSYTYK